MRKAGFSKRWGALLLLSGIVSGSYAQNTFPTSGNVGIGTSGPLTSLSVTPTTTAAKITLWDGGSTTNHMGLGISSNQFNYHVNSTSASHVFYATGKNGDGMELMRIMGNGNVGIGVSAPTAKLAIQGTANVLRLIGSSNNVVQELFANGTGTRSGYLGYPGEPHLYFTNEQASNIVMYNSGGGNFLVYSSNVPKLYIQGGAAKGLSILYDGALQLGAVMNNEDAQIKIGDRTASGSGNSYIDMFGSQNNKGRIIRTPGVNGSFDLMNDGTGAIGFHINNVSRMTLTSNGNLGIGTNAPSAALEVVGQIKMTGGGAGDGKVLTSDANGLASWKNADRMFSGTFTVNGNSNTYYPVLFKDATWQQETMPFGSELNVIGTSCMVEINRHNTHFGCPPSTPSCWVGSLSAKFEYHLSNWGNGANFINARIHSGTNDFIAGWQDMSVNNGDNKMVIWLKGGTTYNWRSPYNVNPEPNLASYPYGLTTKNTIENYALGGAAVFSDIDGGRRIVLASTGDPNYSTVISNRWNYDNAFAITNGNVGIIQAKQSGYQITYGNAGTALHKLLGTRVAIGTEPAAGDPLMQDANNKLLVNGNIGAKKVKVTQTGWPDYVFDAGYDLRSLPDLERFINTNKHLPEVPSAKQVAEQGLDLGDNNAVLLKKIEELTLYIIDLQKQIDMLKQKK